MCHAILGGTILDKSISAVTVGDWSVRFSYFEN